MFKVTSDGDVSFISKSLRIFSDSSERDFMMVFNGHTLGCFSCMWVMRDGNLFCPERYCSLEVNVEYLPDFFFGFDIGDFYVEISNTAHHEEN